MDAIGRDRDGGESRRYSDSDSDYDLLMQEAWEQREREDREATERAEGLRRQALKAMIDGELAKAEMLMRMAEDAQ